MTLLVLNHAAGTAALFAPATGIIRSPAAHDHCLCAFITCPCPMCSLAADFVLRQEQLEQDMDELLHHLNARQGGWGDELAGVYTAWR